VSCVHLVTMAADASEAEIEISQLKDIFKQDCHVICNVGDFTHVVSISFNSWSVKLKFQITGNSHCLCQPLMICILSVIVSKRTAVLFSKFHFIYCRYCIDELKLHKVVPYVSNLIFFTKYYWSTNNLHVM